MEEIPYSLRRQGPGFYLEIRQAWSPKACRIDGSEWASWLGDAQILLLELAAGLQSSVAFAKREARYHLLREIPYPTEITKPEKPS